MDRNISIIAHIDVSFVPTLSSAFRRCAYQTDLENTFGKCTARQIHPGGQVIRDDRDYHKRSWGKPSGSGQGTFEAHRSGVDVAGRVEERQIPYERRAD